MRYLIILAALVATFFGATWFTGLSAEKDCTDTGGTYVDGSCQR